MSLKRQTVDKFTSARGARTLDFAQGNQPNQDQTTTKKQKKSSTLNVFKKKIKNFFNKKATKIKIPHKMKGNKIQKKVWKELKNIKLGSTKSYGQIAKKYNISPRYVGKICGQNKLMLLIPCHRVIKSNGNLGGFSSSGGVNLKKNY